MLREIPRTFPYTALGAMAASESVDEADINRRNGGCGAVVDGKLYIWGGEGSEKLLIPPDDDENSDSDEESDEEEGLVEVWKVTTLPLPRLKEPPFDVYDLRRCTWSRQPTHGEAPLLGLGSSLNVHHDTRTLYLFSGWNASAFDSDVYRIRLEEWRWEKVELKSDLKPSGRYLTGVLIHRTRMCVLGGVGPNITGKDPGARYAAAFTQPHMAFGWNNEYYEFDMEADVWTAPLGEEAVRPNPLGGHCFVKFDQRRALLFGGRYEDGRKNDTRIFDLEERKFMEPLKFSGPLPTGRTFASLTPLIDPDLIGQKLCGCGPVLEQKMLLLWGKQLDDVILDEAWILDMSRLTWTQLDIDMFPRSWHVAAPMYSANSAECQVAIFGGNVHSEGYTGKRHNAGDTRILSFGVKALSWCCLEVIVKQGVAPSMLPSPSLPYRQIKMATEALANRQLRPSIKTRQFIT